MSISNYRNSEQISILKEFYLSQKVNFKIIHSTYSTIFEVGSERIKFLTSNYDKNIFIMSQILKKDFKENSFAQEILKNQYSTDNYDLRWGLKPKNYGKVINIDIKSAYPSALKKFNLITQKTYQKYMKLDKIDRLVAFGMCAKRSTVFEYENGDLKNWDIEVGKYAQIFYFVIEQINKLMIDCKEIAGDYYLFHWVDGIFLEKNTPKKVLDDIVNFINRNNYFCKFEDIDELIIGRRDYVIDCSMIKNGELKEYKMADKNMINTYNQILDVLTNDSIYIPTSITSDVQLSARNAGDDLPM